MCLFVHLLTIQVHIVNSTNDASDKAFTPSAWHLFLPEHILRIRCGGDIVAGIYYLVSGVLCHIGRHLPTPPV